MTHTASYGFQLANRLLAGAGVLSFVAYHHDPKASIVALEHGFDDCGRLTLKCWEDDVAHLPTTAIRFDITKQALDWGSAVTLASLHGTARLEWLPSGGSIRVATITPDEIHLHWPDGTQWIDHTVLDSTVQPFDEFDALQALQLAGMDRLYSLHTEVQIGISEGAVLSDVPYPLKEHQKNRLWVGDVSSTGLILIASTENRLVTTLVDLPLEAHEPTDLVRAVSAAIL